MWIQRNVDMDVSNLKYLMKPMANFLWAHLANYKLSFGYACCWVVHASPALRPAQQVCELMVVDTGEDELDGRIWSLSMQLRSLNARLLAMCGHCFKLQINYLYESQTKVYLEHMEMKEKLTWCFRLFYLPFDLKCSKPLVQSWTLSSVAFVCSELCLLSVESDWMNTAAVRAE